MEDRHLSLSEVAELMGVAERTVRRWIKSGKLRAYKPGRDYRIPESAVKEFIEGSEAYPKKVEAPSTSGRPEGQTVTVGSERTIIWRVEELLINAMRRAREGEDEHKIAREVARSIEELRAS